MSHNAHRQRPRPRGLSQKSSHTPVGLGTRKGIYPAKSLQEQEEAVFLQPPASLFTGWGWKRQTTELQPTPPGADLLTFQSVTSWEYIPRHTLGSVHPFLTSPHSVCGDRHPGNGVESEGQGTTVYHNSLRRKQHQTAALPPLCMLIP